MSSPQDAIDELERLLIRIAELSGSKLIVDPTLVGDRWVIECVSRFEHACGEGSVLDLSRRQLPYDLIVCGKKVQCKSRRLRRSGQVSLHQDARRYKRSNFDFVALKCGEKRFVIPVGAITRADGTLINDFFVCDVEQFEDAWSLLAQAEQWSRHLPLFNNGGD